MQIGEFAKICNTKISVLRHYDKEGLLPPDYIDRFSGYRYYSKEQISDFFKISALKSAGFSLSEIKAVIAEHKGDEAIIALFDKKKSELQETLQNLAEAKKTILGVEQLMKIRLIETDRGSTLRTAKIDPSDISDAYDRMDKTISAEGYQRVSGFRTYGKPEEKEVEIACDVVKLTDNEIVLNEDTDLPFENDDTLIGKWEIVGEFAVKEDFYAGRCYNDRHKKIDGIYFLPNGEHYWCYGWTKGKLIIDSGDATSVNNFSTEMYDGQRYMFVDLKSYNYRHGGKTTVLVLRQLDNKVYTAAEIARKDNIDMPFTNDAAVLGRWKAVDFCLSKDDFDPGRSDESNDETWYFSNVEFRPNGEVISYYDHGKEVIESGDMQEWTRGFVLRKWNHTACAYEIRNAGEKEYLIMEWKSGDYRWGGFDTDYYVFVRE